MKKEDFDNIARNFPEIEKQLTEDAARPTILHNVANTCWQPAVKGLVLQGNSIYNNWRFEDVWLDK